MFIKLPSAFKSFILSIFEWPLKTGKAAVRSKAVVLLLLTFCLLLLPLWESVIVLCFDVLYFISILVLQSSWWGRESWLLCLICLPGFSWWLSGSFSRCHGLICGLWLWYFLIILTYYFYCMLKVFSYIINLLFCFELMLFQGRLPRQSPS